MEQQKESKHSLAAAVFASRFSPINSYGNLNS